MLAKNFQTNITAFDKIPGSELYIFPSDSPDPNATAVENPAGQVPSPFAYRFSQEPFTQTQGGSLKYADSSKFNVSTQIAVAEVHVAPGAMREIHVSSILIRFRSFRSLGCTTVAPDSGRVELFHRGHWPHDDFRVF